MKFREDGLALYQEGRYSAALELFLAEEIDPAEDSELAYLMGLCHARLGENEEALRLLAQAAESGNHLARIYQARMLSALLLIDEGRLEEAEDVIQVILNDGYESPQAWSALGFCRWRRGRMALALESYREAVALDEANPNAANGLGYLLADSGEDPQLAVDLCRRAVESDPENMAYRDSLGWALYHAGKPEEAVLYLTEALSRRPEDDVIRNHLEAVRTHETD